MSVRIRALVLALAAGVAVAAPAGARAGETGVTGNISGFFGAKVLDNHDWAPAEDHEEVGLVADLRSTTFPVGAEIRVLRSRSDTVFEPTTAEFIRLETSELDLGLRKTWDGGPNPRPYLSGGVAKIDADLTFVGTGTASDSATGIWVAGGVYWVLGGSLSLGADLMLSTAEVDFGTPVKADVGGGHFNLWLGFHF
jgi:Outer membrane protein beta-barrel domain